MSYRYTIETENPIVTDGNKMFNCTDGKLRLKIVADNPWHTGLPTQYGEYVCLVHSMKCPSVKHKTIMEWGEHCAEKQDWFNREGGCDYEVIAWFLLPPCPYGKEWDIKSPFANLKRKGRSRSK